MLSFSIQRRIYVIGLVGPALLISGLFLPWITTNFSEPFPPSSTESVWAQIMSQVTFHGFDWSSATSISFYFLMLLPLLTGIWTSLVGLFGKGKRVLFVLHLAFVIIGLVIFLFSSYVAYCLFYCGATGPWALKGTRVLDPGFWLILGGFLLSLGTSIAEIWLFKLRATERGA
jgi:hypothetical protein